MKNIYSESTNYYLIDIVNKDKIKIYLNIIEEEVKKIPVEFWKTAYDEEMLIRNKNNSK